MNNMAMQELDSLPLSMLELMAQAIGHTLQGIILTDASGTILYVNPAFSLSTGYDFDEVVGKNPKLLQSGKHEPGFYTELWRTVSETGQWQGEIWNRRKNGEIYVEWLNISAIRTKAGQATHYCAVFSDITERIQLEYKLKAENRKLEQLAMLDSLTGVANRRAFDLTLKRDWARALRTNQPVSLLLIDVDFFKVYNDLYGHQQGDEALRLVAAVLRGVLQRSVDLLARYGGEEFAVILPDTELEGAVLVGQALRDSIASAKIPHMGSRITPYITISVGCAAQVPTMESTWENLILTADNALYSAKEKGRNRVQIRA
jgi:two-component system, cell cycle response regulator